MSEYGRRRPETGRMFQGKHATIGGKKFLDKFSVFWRNTLAERWVVTSRQSRHNGRAVSGEHPNYDLSSQEGHIDLSLTYSPNYDNQ